MKTISAAIKNSFQITGEAVALFRFYYNTTQYITLASDSLPSEWAGAEYRDLLSQFPSISSGVKNFKMETSDVRLPFKNGIFKGNQRLSDYINTGPGAGNDSFKNRRCTIKFWAPGITNWDDCFLVKEGITREITHTDKEVVFTVQDSSQQFTDDFPQALITTADGAFTPSVNEVKPEVYGDHLFRVNANDSNGLPATEWTRDRVNNLTDMIDLGNGQWFIANHECHNLPADSTAITNGVTIWAWDGTLQQNVEVVDWTRIQNSSSGAIISIDSDSYYAYVAVTRGSTVAVEWTDAFPDTTPSHISDGDITTTTTASIAGGDGGGTTKTQTLALGLAQFIQNVTEANVYMKYNDTGIGVNLELTIDTGQYTTGTTTDFRKSGAGITLSSGQVPATVDLVYSKPDPGAESGTVTCFQAYLRVEYTNPDLLQLRFGGFGKPSGGSVIEDAEDCIDDVAQSFGMTTDTAAFAAANTGVKFAFALSKQESGIKTLNDMAKQARSQVFFNNDNELSIKVIEDTYTASDFKIDWDDIIGTPKFTQTPLKNVKTKTTVQFAMSGGKLTGVTDALEDATAQAEYNVTAGKSLLPAKADKIGAEAEADVLNAFNLAEEMNQHIITGLALPRKYWKAEEGDIFEFENMPTDASGATTFKAYGLDLTINNTIAGQTIYKYFQVETVKLNLSTVTITAKQRHDLS